MKDARWQEISRLYFKALELPEIEREAFLGTCKDEGLRQEVLSLLANQAMTRSFLEGPAVAITPGFETKKESSLIGKQFGSYHILSELGRGGMGEVYRAHDGKLGRDVAVKVLPEAFAANPERMARFQREARVLASLSHPNIASIYGLEESGNVGALVMELVPGQTLAERIAKGPIEVEEMLSFARQICEAVSCAHGQSVIHRDLKPANIMITQSGLVKVLDFGLAKLAAAEDATTETAAIPRTDAGTVVGTIGYMSPEQLRGLPLDNRTDLFSLGAVLYEMVKRERPFTGSTPTAVADAILHAQPRDFGDSPVPAKLKAIIAKLLEKDPAHRYGSAAEVIQELKALEISLAPVRSVRLSRNAWIAVGAAAVLAGVLAVWFWRSSSRERWAFQKAIPEITHLIDVGEYAKAAGLVQEARAVIPRDPALEKLWLRATGEVSVASVPSDAVVSVRLYKGDPNAWETLGKTPLQKVRLPLDSYAWRVVKPGFASAFFIAELTGPPIPGFPTNPSVNVNPGLVNRPNLKMELKLRPEASVRSEMVVVSGGVQGLGFPLTQAPAVKVDDFLIDRHEVTNEEYKRFVDAGGYQKREFWKQDFVRDGRTVSWGEAVAVFHDATGRPGPATWEVGGYPKGHEKYPVAGVSWYEAAAYAEFVGKNVPTAYHWTRASQSSFNTPLISSGSNFKGEGTQPVESDRALSGFGTTDMAGNVKEWCLNESENGKRLILGGGFGEPPYMFNHTDAQSPWERKANFGFRCVKLDSPPTAAAAAPIEVKVRDYWKEKPVKDDEFKGYTAQYVYDKGNLNAQVDETASMELSSCERVTFDAAYGRERVTAYLFLPTNASPPFQTIVYFPGVMAFFDDKLDLSSVEETRDFLLKSGRALIFPIYKGTYERRDGFNPYTSLPASFREHTVAWAKDLGRSLDYLETRKKDIDSAKVAYFGDSAGGQQGPLLLAVEKRIKAAILQSGGFSLTLHLLPDSDPFNFAPHVTVPVLMLGGKYDTTFPVESSQLPLFHLLGTPSKDKNFRRFDGGHCAFPRPDAVRECLDWLDKYLGRVRP
jgi:serine/threonine protein kinase